MLVGQVDHLVGVDHAAVGVPDLLEGCLYVVVSDPPATVLDQNSSEAQLDGVIRRRG